jgi:hypothetical protein
MNLQDDFDRYTELDPGDRLAIIVRDDSLGANALLNISVYESRLERSMDKAVRELQRLRSMRCSQMKNQSQFAPATPDPEPAPPAKPQARLDTAPPVNEPRSEAPVSRAEYPRHRPSHSNRESLRMRQPCQNELNDRTPSSGRIRRECPGGSL